MFDELIRLSRVLKSAYQDLSDAESLLEEAKARVESGKKAVRAFSVDGKSGYDLRDFKEILYPFEGGIYLIRYSDGGRALVAEKVEFYKPTETQSNV